MSVYKTIDRNKKRQQVSFRRFMKGQSTPYIREYVSLNYLELKEWIESRMIDEMNWENYGKTWVIDHIVPMWLFDLFNENDLKLAWNYKNLMPLFKEDNLHKQGDLRFSLLVLNRMEKSFIVDKLIQKVEVEINQMNKYLK